MIPTSLIRLGGLVSIVGGASYAALGFMMWLCTPNCPRSSGYVVLAFFVLLVFGAMVALASLHAIQRERYGLLGTLAFLVAIVGVAMIFVSESRNLILVLWLGSPGAGGVSWLFIIGLLVATVGLIAYGVTTITASALPWWCGLALIAGSLAGLRRRCILRLPPRPARMAHLGDGYGVGRHYGSRGAACRSVRLRARYSSTSSHKGARQCRGQA